MIHAFLIFYLIKSHGYFLRLWKKNLWKWDLREGDITDHTMDRLLLWKCITGRFCGAHGEELRLPSSFLDTTENACSTMHNSTFLWQLTCVRFPNWNSEIAIHASVVPIQLLVETLLQYNNTMGGKHTKLQRPPCRPGLARHCHAIVWRSSEMAAFHFPAAWRRNLQLQIYTQHGPFYMDNHNTADQLLLAALAGRRGEGEAAGVEEEKKSTDRTVTNHAEQSSSQGSINPARRRDIHALMSISASLIHFHTKKTCSEIQQSQQHFTFYGNPFHTNAETTIIHLHYYSWSISRQQSE